MIYLIWATLNLALWLYFFYLIAALIFMGRRVFQGKLRAFSILILVVGVGHLLSASDGEATNQITFAEKHDSSNGSRSQRITLDDNLSFATKLWIGYSVEGDTLVPVSCSSSISGFVCGFEWQLDLATSDEIRKDEEAFYQVSGILKWNLFGVNVYNQDKNFSSF